MLNITLAIHEPFSNRNETSGINVGKRGSANRIAGWNNLSADVVSYYCTSIDGF